MISARDSRMLRSISTLTIWLATLSTFPSSERLSSGLPMSTAITTSAHMSRTMSTGMLRDRPPSTSSLPSTSTGEKTEGTAMLARTAVTRLPRDCTTSSPCSRSVAMALKGIGNWSKDCSTVLDSSNLCRKNSIF